MLGRQREKSDDNIFDMFEMNNLPNWSWHSINSSKSKETKEDDEKRNAKEKNKQMDLFKQLFDYKNQEDVDVAMMTGCTANVCCIDQAKRKIYFANSGDSRSVMCKKGIAYPMSVDHKPEMDIEKNRIYKADGWVSEGRVKGKKNLFILY